MYVIVPPGVSVVTSAVLVIVSCGTEATLAVAVHGAGVLPGVQMPPGGGSAVAVLSIEPGALAATIAVTVYVTKLPVGNLVSVSAIAPVPAGGAARTGVGRARPALARDAGGDRIIDRVLLAATGPVLVTVIV